MLSCSVNQKMVQQAQVLIILFTGVILSLNHSKQKVGGEERKALLIVF